MKTWIFKNFGISLVKMIGLLYEDSFKQEMKTDKYGNPYILNWYWMHQSIHDGTEQIKYQDRISGKIVVKNIPKFKPVKTKENKEISQWDLWREIESKFIALHPICAELFYLKKRWEFFQWDHLGGRKWRYSYSFPWPKWWGDLFNKI